MDRLLVLVFLLLTISGCSKDIGVSHQQLPKADELYNTALQEWEKHNYEKAADLFEQVEKNHPLSSWATKAQKMEIESLYMAGKYDDAIISADRFIYLHPVSDNIEYIYYLKALCYYDEIPTPDLDQEHTMQAKIAFNQLINNFPHSKYVREAKMKLELINDHIAAKEMMIGRFYLHKYKLTAALRRFSHVITHYDTTSHVAEALYRMTEIYASLKLYDEAKKYAAILGHNYNHSKWYERAFELLK